MSTDASIAMSVKDNLSAAVVTMKNSMTTFRTDVKELQGELDRLSATRVQMKMDLTGAKREAQQAQRAFQALGDSATEAERQAAQADWQQAEENLENIRQQYELVSRQVRQTTRDFESASGAISRADNRTAASSGGGLLSTLGKAGLYSMVGEAAGQWAGTLVSSSFGSEAGSLFSSALSGVGSGAAIGSMVGGPGLGTAVGAALGGVVGLVSGAGEAYSSRDEAFKNYYAGVYDTQAQAVQESAASGSATASQRQLDAIAFDRLLGEEAGGQFLSDLRRTAADTPMEYEDLTAISRSLATGFGNTPERMLELIEDIGDAGSAVGVTASDMDYMAQAMSRMQSSGKATLEYLNIFQDRGVDVIGMLSEAMGKTQGEIYDMISGGKISGQTAVDIIQQGMEERYGGAMETMSQTFSGLTSTLSDTMTEIYNAGGEGYNASRSEAMAMEIEAYGGSLGDALKEAYTAIGAGQAALENLGEAYTRDALSAVLEGGALTQDWDASAIAQLQEQRAKYQEAMAAYNAGDETAGVVIDDIIATAEGLAQEQYEASDLYKQNLDAEAESLTALRENTAALGAATAAYGAAQERTKGKGTFSEESVGVPTGPYTTSQSSLMEDLSHVTPYASGLARVPYDGYPAILHQDERVLTAREAREQDRTARPIQVTITGNSFGSDVTAEDIAQKLADALERKLAAGVI